MIKVNENGIEVGLRICKLHTFLLENRKRKPEQYEAVRILWDKNPGDTIVLSATETKDGKAKTFTIQ